MQFLIRAGLRLDHSYIPPPPVQKLALVICGEIAIYILTKENFSLLFYGGYVRYGIVIGLYKYEQNKCQTYIA